MLLYVWLAGGLLTAPFWGVSIYHDGFSDGTVRRHNLRASIAFAPLFGLGWPLFIVLAVFGLFLTWIDGGN